MNAMEIMMLKKKRPLGMVGVPEDEDGADLDTEVLQELQDKMDAISMKRKPDVAIKIEDKTPETETDDDIEEPEDGIPESSESSSDELDEYEDPGKKIKRLEEELKALKMGRTGSALRF